MLAKKPGIDGSEYINASYLHVSFDFYKIKSVLLKMLGKFGVRLIETIHKKIKKLKLYKNFNIFLF